MAFYDYFCSECGYRFETQHGMQEQPLTICPSCGHAALAREIGVPMVFVEKSDENCTLGTLAERNSKRFSEEKKQMLSSKTTEKKQYVREI